MPTIVDADVRPAGRGSVRGSNRRPLTSAQQDLVEDYVPLARRLAKPFVSTYRSDKEEIYGEVMLALVEAAQSFESSRNVKFATFARYRIEGSLRDWRRRKRLKGYSSDPMKAPQVFSLSQAIEENSRALIADPEWPAHEVADTLAWCLKRLPPRLSAICQGMYVNGRSQKAVAESLGISTPRLCDLHAEAISVLRAALVRDGAIDAPPQGAPLPQPVPRTE